MSHDPLSDVLRSVRLRDAVFYYVSFGGDEWVAETPASAALASALMPGADHVLAYHLMARGDPARQARPTTPAAWWCAASWPAT